MNSQSPIDTMGSLDKLMTADMARLMSDNQRVLDRANRRADLFAAWEAKQVLGEEMPEIADDMQISIDSPVTTTHHHAAPVMPPPSPGIGKFAALALGAGLLATGIGVPLGAWMIGSAGRTGATGVEKVIEKTLTGSADVSVGNVTISEGQ